MSLVKNNENEQTNNAVQQSETSQKRAYFTREMLHREVERLKKRNSSSHTSQGLSEEYEPEPSTEEMQTATVPLSISEIRAKVGVLLDQTGANTQNSRTDERVLLMASAVLQMCDLLTSYSENMSREMARLNENALQNLSLQEQYAKSIKTEVSDSVYGIYHQVKEQEKEAVNELMQYVEANSNQMEKDITACTENVKSATAAAEKASKKIAKSLERFRRVKTFRDLLYYTSPVLVAVDVILRVIALAAHTP